jgi:hypothetical protein
MAGKQAVSLPKERRINQLACGAQYVSLVVEQEGRIHQKL